MVTVYMTKVKILSPDPM